MKETITHSDFVVAGVFSLICYEQVGLFEFWKLTVLIFSEMSIWVLFRVIVKSQLLRYGLQLLRIIMFYHMSNLIALSSAIDTVVLIVLRMTYSPSILHDSHPVADPLRRSIGSGAEQTLYVGTWFLRDAS